MVKWVVVRCGSIIRARRRLVESGWTEKRGGQCEEARDGDNLAHQMITVQHAQP